ncbi:MAG TPA: Smr/MutS family protein [Casimicrobiaceae bacterium]|nr:Smr/MutS family protein [Casimicrobiaceae bacterium]
MAKLSDLKALLDADAAKRATAPGSSRHQAPAAASPRAAIVPRSMRKPDPVSTPQKRRLAASKHADGDIDIAAAFADVAPLPPPRRAAVARIAPSPVPRQRIADEAEALLASKFGAEPGPTQWDVGQEIESEQTFVRKGIGSDVLPKLRRGHWSVQAEIDLHGHTSTEAHDALADFLVDARVHRLRCVRVIHGKGLTSPGREPVLKGKVRRWLAHWDDVLAYAEAPQHAGGGGAVLVLLRGATKNP